MITEIFPKQYADKVEQMKWISENSPAGKRIIELLYDGDIEKAATDCLVGDIQSGKIEESLSV